jgi:hypothetical protein
MKIKKSTSSGGAAIAGRLQLPSTPAPKKAGPSAGKTGLGWAVGAGVVALGVSGTLVYMLYQHWQFLMPA